MRRVLVLGASGVGKTTFATALAERLGVHAIHLDAHYYPDGFDFEPDQPTWQERVARLVAQPAWVMDGNYSSTLATRLAVCDAVVVLDYPRSVCLWSLARRWWAHRGGRVRRELPPTCIDRWSWEVARFTWEYRQKRLPMLLQRIAEIAPTVPLWQFKRRREAEAFLVKTVESR